MTRRRQADRRGGRQAARIAGIDPARAEGEAAAVQAARAKRRGASLATHPLYARRPSSFRGARAMWAGSAASGRIDAAPAALVNRRVAQLNGCPSWTRSPRRDR